MSPARASVIIAGVAVAGAAVLALVARTPADLRAGANQGPTNPELGASFTDRQVASHGSFREITYTSFALFLLVEAATLVVLARGPLGRLVSATETKPGGWALSALVAGVVIAAVLALATLPLGYVRGLVVERDWGLSTQSVGTWLLDYARGVGVSMVIGAISAVAFFGVTRAQPRSWWIVGWATFSVLNALFVYLWPIVVAPIFNKFESLEESPLRTRVLALANEAGVDVDDVLVADASRRTTAENAYVAGLGPTKRLVLYDTLVEGGDDAETEFVVAHELGHQAENHVIKGVLAATVGLGAGFALLAWLATKPGFWEWAGASGVRDVRALAVVLLFAAVVGLLTLPVENLISRSFEKRADEIAVELTRDPGTAVRVFRRLAFTNIADLRPPRAVVWLLFSHPSVADRIRSATGVQQTLHPVGN